MSKFNKSTLEEKCSDCGKPITDIAIDKGKKTLCKECFNKPLIIVIGDKRQGMSSASLELARRLNGNALL